MKVGWKIKLLTEICETTQGVQISKSKQYKELKNGRKRYLYISDFKNESNLKYVENIYSNKIVCENDLVVVNTGASAGDVFRGIDGVLSNNLFKVSFNKNEVLSNYLFYFLRSYIFKDFQKKIKRGAANPHMGHENFGLTPFPYPSISEQQRIVVILDEAFSAINKAKANAEKNLKDVKELFESFLNNLFINKGEDWEEKPLGELAVFRNGMNFTKGSKGELVKIVGVKDFQNKFWVNSETLDSVTIDGKLNEIDFLKDGDILAVRSNGNPELIGRTLLAGKCVSKVCHSGFTIRIRLKTNKVLPLYLCHFIKTQRIRKELVESGTGVNIKSLNQGALSSLNISYPLSLLEQEAIIRQLELLSVETKKLEVLYQRKLSNLEELKKSILQKAFSGELKTIEVALAL